MLVTEKAKVFSIPLETTIVVKKTGNIKWYKSYLCERFSIKKGNT